MQFSERPIHAHARRVFVESEGESDFFEAPLFEEAEHNRRAIRFAQLVHDIIKHGFDLPPDGLGRIGGEQFVHGLGLLFASLPPVFRTTHVSGHLADAGVEPACQRRVPDEAGGFSGQFGKDCLGYVFRQTSIAVDLAQRR